MILAPKDTFDKNVYLNDDKFSRLFMLAIICPSSAQRSKSKPSYLGRYGRFDWILSSINTNRYGPTNYGRGTSMYIIYIYMFIRTQMQIQMVHVKKRQWKHIETEKEKKEIEKKRQTVLS